MLLSPCPYSRSACGSRLDMHKPLLSTCPPCPHVAKIGQKKKKCNFFRLIFIFLKKKTPELLPRSILAISRQVLKRKYKTLYMGFSFSRKSRPLSGYVGTFGGFCLSKKLQASL